VQGLAQQRLDRSVVEAGRAARSTQRAKARARAACLPGGGPGGRRSTNVPAPGRPSTRPSCSSSR
jgi:hypothetical protein